jgi:hypothetical protein
MRHKFFTFDVERMRQKKAGNRLNSIPAHEQV